jgi:acyl-CoA thioesterase-2
MPSAMETLLAVLDLETIEADRFRGISPQSGLARVFGGQVIGQALVAACRTVDARPVHSLHAYFLRPGNPTVPILYEVDRIRDGRSFTTRRVLALQDGAAIFSMSASFHVPEPGLEHQAAMPAVPMPEDLPGDRQLAAALGPTAPDGVRRFFERERPIEIRPLDLRHYVTRDVLEPVQRAWLSPTGPLPDDPVVHAAVLGYLSDMTLLDTSLFAHGRSVFDRDLQLASLDHAMWFHGPARVDGWLLYACDSPVVSGSRGLNRGSIYTRDGVLIASTAQEGLVRMRR